MYFAIFFQGFLRERNHTNDVEVSKIHKNCMYQISYTRREWLKFNKRDLRDLGASLAGFITQAKRFYVL